MSWKPWMIACAAALAGSAAFAFPDRPVTIIVPNAPGGPVDVVARLLADELSQTWKQPVVVDNRPAGAGVVAGNQLARAQPDGHTLGIVVQSAITILPFVMDSLPYDPVQAFAPISLVARTPFIFVTAAEGPLRTWQDLVKVARSREIDIGSYPAGTAFHIAWELTRQQAGITGLYVPANSGAQVQAELINGDLDAALEAPSSAKGMLDAGRLRAIAITSAERLAILPDTPTLAEAGLAGFSFEPWFSLMAPAGTSPVVIDQIGADLAAALAAPKVKAQLDFLGMIPMTSSPQALAELVQKDRARMLPVLRDLGLAKTAQ